MQHLNDTGKNELIAKCDRFKSLKHSATNPYAFNEYGVISLSSVLNSKIAITINKKIIKVFVELRKQIAINPSYALLSEKIKKIEAEQESIKLAHEMDAKIVTTKVTQLSREVKKMSQILDEFQDTHLIIKRPESEKQEG